MSPDEALKVLKGVVNRRRSTRRRIWLAPLLRLERLTGEILGNSFSVTLDDDFLSPHAAIATGRIEAVAGGSRLTVKIERFSVLGQMLEVFLAVVAFAIGVAGVWFKISQLLPFFLVDLWAVGTYVLWKDQERSLRILLTEKIWTDTRDAA